MSAPLRIAIAGALGRMGHAIAAAVEAHPDMTVAARFDRPGLEAEGLVPVEAALDACDVVIDFTVGGASAALAERCAARGGPAMIIGATGISDADLSRIAEAAKRVPIVQSGNYSLGVNILTGLVEQAARALAAEAYDIEVFEAHHRRKIDAPSGTALMLGAAAAAGRNVKLSEVERRARDGITGARPVGEIGFSVMRGGGIVGEHSVIFAAEDEIVTISHSGRDRGLFARGAVEAARWIAGQAPGRIYDMQDVLGMRAQG